MRLIEHLISTIAPHRCLACSAEGTLLCHTCFASVKQPSLCCYKCAKPAINRICSRCNPTTNFHSIQIAAMYEGVALTLVHKLKFERSPAAVLPIATLLAGCISGEYRIVTHVPTATRRIRQRGYDQAALVARQVAKLTGFPYRPLLRRLGQQRQLGQDRSGRQQQLQDAYRTFGTLPSKNTPILLIDDVITTGSTLNAAAATLRQAGMLEAHAAAFAAA